MFSYLQMVIVPSYCKKVKKEELLMKWYSWCGEYVWLRYVHNVEYFSLYCPHERLMGLFPTMKMIPNTASQRRRLEAGFHSNFTQLYGVNWKAIRFIFPLRERERESRDAVRNTTMLTLLELSSILTQLDQLHIIHTFHISVKQYVGNSTYTNNTKRHQMGFS